MKVEVEVLDHIFRQENSLINGTLSHQRHASAPTASMTLQPGSSLPPRGPGKLGNAKNYRYNSKKFFKLMFQKQQKWSRLISRLHWVACIISLHSLR
jgi:hypothetical protein